MRRLTLLVVLVAFIFSCGGHWAILQTLAWANMIREYSTMVPLAQAVQMTFSGQYPCSLCKAIADQKTSQQEKLLELDKHDKKMVAAPVLTLAAPAVVSSIPYLSREAMLVDRAEAPPTPPPRSALVS